MIKCQRSPRKHHTCLAFHTLQRYLSSLPVFAAGDSQVASELPQIKRPAPLSGAAGAGSNGVTQSVAAAMTTFNAWCSALQTAAVEQVRCSTQRPFPA
jgi:hypothetical protein